jgi:L-threonylcarbamoyladenylate synthase
VTNEQVAIVLGHAPAGQTAAAPRVSGSLPSHYAPRARVEIVAPDQIQCRTTELLAAGQKIALLCQTPADFEDSKVNLHVLPLPQSSAEYAHSLYALLRQVDDLGCDIALVTLPSAEGLGAAIVDRLRRAAGPRGEDSP